MSSNPSSCHLVFFHLQNHVFLYPRSTAVWKPSLNTQEVSGIFLLGLLKFIQPLGVYREIASKSNLEINFHGDRKPQSRRKCSPAHVGAFQPSWNLDPALLYLPQPWGLFQELQELVFSFPSPSPPPILPRLCRLL